MGQTGSDTRKATITASLMGFTKWSPPEMAALFHRCSHELADTFALRFAEFEFLLSRDLTGFRVARDLFNNMLDTDKNKLVDKFEIVLLVTLLSSLTNQEKVEYMFEVFNFNKKGFLTKPEASLLFNTLVKAVEKADSAIRVPSSSLLQDLHNIAFNSFSLSDESHETIRKPELVNFAANVVYVQRYLDAWRGHAGQVLLPKKVKWRDPFFPCNETSLMPSREWIQLASTPPAHFVYWRRKELVGVWYRDADADKTTTGSYMLFTHTEAPIKSFDKRKSYNGLGALANGYLVQGMLADRWMLNGMACAASRPPIFAFLFPPTGQEHIGRFCVRLFEGAGWRSVFVDDRVPCSPDVLPLFAHSSDVHECWPLILEKAWAKYFGSYGHLGLCSTRPDATATALRMLTGGHVMRVAVADLTWTSMPSEVREAEGEVDGFALVERMRAEGSIVAFGRSESLAMHGSTLKHSPRDPMPHGFLFPVVGSFVKDQRHRFLTLRDAFGHLVPPSSATGNNKADQTTGHCHLHDVRVDGLRQRFDIMLLCRFPDALRVGADRLGWQQWKTHITKASCAGPSAPAVFKLTVHAMPPPPPKAKKETTLRLSKLRERHKGVTDGDLDVVTQGMNTRFDFNRPRMVPGEIGTAPPAADKEEDDEEKEETEANEKSKVVDGDGALSFALTVSSSCDWSIAGSQQAEAQLRLRVVPAVQTIKALQAQRLAALEREKQRMVAAAEQKRRQAKLLEDAAAPVDDSTHNLVSQRADAPPVTEENDGEQAPAPASEPQPNDTKQMPEQQPARPTAPASGSHAEAEAEAEAKEAAAIPRPRLQFEDKERVLREEFFETRAGVNSSWLSQNLMLVPGEYFVSCDVSFSMTKEKLLELTTPRDPSEAPWLDNRPHTVDEVWAQASSCAPFELRSLEPHERPRFAASVASVAVPPERHPFSFETPGEAASRGVELILSRLKAQAETLDLEYVATRTAIKKSYRQARRESVI